MDLWRDTWLIFQRQMLLVSRNLIWPFMAVLQPVLYLLLFGPLLKAALHVPSTSAAYTIFVPGLLVMLAMFGPLYSGFALLAEMRNGVVARMRVTPASRLAMLLGRSLRDIVMLLVQALAIVLIALVFQLDVRLGDALLAFLVLSLVGLMLSSVSYALALKIRSEEALGPLLNMFIQPVLLLSGILLPLTNAPAWLTVIARVNPFLWIVDGIRALFAGTPAAAEVWQALLVAVVFAGLATYWAARSFARLVR
jgi:ABC-2 type transport system permease protein